MKWYKDDERIIDLMMRVSYLDSYNSISFADKVQDTVCWPQMGIGWMILDSRSCRGSSEYKTKYPKATWLGRGNPMLIHCWVSKFNRKGGNYIWYTSPTCYPEKSNSCSLAINARLCQTLLRCKPMFDLLHLEASREFRQYLNNGSYQYAYQQVPLQQFRRLNWL